MYEDIHSGTSRFNMYFHKVCFQLQKNFELENGRTKNLFGTKVLL
jgi:hypothetical protein